MKLTWAEIFGLAKWGYGVIKYILSVDQKPIKDTVKHEKVKQHIMPIIVKKGWKFTPDDVDKIINGAVWFVKKVVRSK